MTSPRIVGCTTLVLGLSSMACSAADVASPATSSALDSHCEEEIAAPAARMGASGRATLLYPCDGDACTGNESFASQVQHVISIEVDAGPDAVLHIESSDPSVAQVADVASTFDPCVSKVKAWATLDARSPGSTRLQIRDARGELDLIEVDVAEPAAIRLRITPTQSFAFESARLEMRASEGESWLVLPELYDARENLLVGLPELTWEVSDPHVAEVRTTPQTDDEQLVRQHAGLGAAFIEAKQVGETGLHVHAESGAQAWLLLRVVAP